MEKITKEQIQAKQFLDGCGGDIVQALERLEMLLDEFFINGQYKKAVYIEKLIVCLRRG